MSKTIRHAHHIRGLNNTMAEGLAAIRHLVPKKPPFTVTYIPKPKAKVKRVVKQFESMDELMSWEDGKRIAKALDNV